MRLLFPIFWVALTAPVAAEDYQTLVAPFVKQHCLRCHSGKEPEAELSLTGLEGDFRRGEQAQTWKQIAERLILNEMPPADQPRPDARQTVRVIEWIRGELHNVGIDTADLGEKLKLPQHGNRVDHATLFRRGGESLAASPARLWRINPAIYERFGKRVADRVSLGQPFSTSSAEGFKDYADLFVIDEPTINQLLRNAQGIVAYQLGKNASQREFKELRDAGEKPTREQLTRALAKEFELVLQRQPDELERQRFLELMDRNIQEAGAEVGVRATLATVFLLPEALYRLELGRGEPDAQGRRLLAPRELALAIGLALSDQGPDGPLLHAASEGKLQTREQVRREIERLLGDPKFPKPRIMGFFDEYFGYTAAGDVFKDVGRGKYRPEVIVNDTRLLIQDILDRDRDVLKELLTTNKSYVNYRYDEKAKKAVAAREYKKKQPKQDKKTGELIPLPPRDLLKEWETHDHYSLPVDWEFEPEQPLTFPANERAGILTQPSWLAAYGTNNENHAIRRGKWIRERLFGDVIPDLPISVDAQLPDAPQQTLRERMQVTEQKYCWQCHQRMNPPGLLFEHYDFMGRYRTTEAVLDPVATEYNVDSKGKSRGPVLKEVPVNSRGKVTVSGDPQLSGEYGDIVELMHQAAESEHVRQVFIRHAFRYWMGRNETLDDASTLVAADEVYVQSGGSFRQLLLSLLTSDSYLYRRETTPSTQLP